MKRFEILLPWDYNDGTQVERITQLLKQIRTTPETEAGAAPAEADAE